MCSQAFGSVKKLRPGRKLKSIIAGEWHKKKLNIQCSERVKRAAGIDGISDTPDFDAHGAASVEYKPAASHFNNPAVERERASLRGNICRRRRGKREFPFGAPCSRQQSNIAARIGHRPPHVRRLAVR